MNIRELIADTEKNAITHGSIPFWSWNDRLGEEELRRQIGVMQDLHMNGFFMHARGGLETEYLSDEWFDRISACVDEAKKRGMEAWSYDENGWPSGFAGGELLKDKRNFATYLEGTDTDVFPTDGAVLGVYVLEGTKIRRVKEAQEAGTVYHVIYQRWDNSYVDTLDGEITRKFLSATHDEYKKRLAPADFGKAMPGFFTDEPQYYRYATVWSETMPREFYDAFGQDVFDAIPALFWDFDGARELRYEYWKLCHHLFINHWIRPVYEWCEENGCRLTGHAVEESCLFTQMWCCGGVMPFYEYEHIPGMDYLGRGLADEAAPKQLGSACAQLGKKKVLSEMFACCGWDVTPTELKRIAEMQYSGGVNVMCQHLYAYSIRGQRKRDYPANYSEHLPWQKFMADFNTYFNNLGYLLSRGAESVNTLVIHPIHDAYLDYKRTTDNRSIEKLENHFHEMVRMLANAQVPYHFGDETMMAKMAHVDGGKISVGLCTYEYVIVPDIETLDASTVSLIKEFLANGGKVCFLGQIPSRIDGKKADLSFLSSTCTMEEILSAEESTVVSAPAKHRLRQMVRKTDAGRLVYLVNLGEETQEDVVISVKGAKCLCELDLETLALLPVRGEYKDGAFTLHAEFGPALSHMYVECGECAPVSPAVPMPEKKKIPLKSGFTFAEQPENALTLDRFEVSTDGGDFSEERPIERIRDNLLAARHKGKVTLRAHFTVDEMPESLFLTVEPLAGNYTVNGSPVVFDRGWYLDRSFRTADILPLTKKGENEIVFTFDYFQRDYVYHVLYDNVMESLRNCLVFDTEVECMYLHGRFAVKTPGTFEDGEKRSCIYHGTFALTRQNRETDVRNFVTAGYPFFAGTMELRTTYTYHAGGAAELVLPGRYAVCEVKVNGVPAGKLLFTDRLDLSAFLCEGENEIVLSLTNSNRNLLGPHHGTDPEPYGVSPVTFSMENRWKGGECPVYRDRYSFVRFGIDL